MILLALVFCVHSVSTSLIDSVPSDDAVVVLKSGASGKEVLLVDPSLLFSETNEQNSITPSDNTGLPDTSFDIARQVFGNKIETEFRHRLNGSPGLDHLKKARVQSENETINLSTPGSPLTPRSSEILPWLINEPSTNRLESINTFKTHPPENEITQSPDLKSSKILSRQFLENKISDPWLYSNSGSSDRFVSINLPVSENSTTNLLNYSSTKIPRLVETKEISLDHLRWFSNDSVSSNPLIFLKRYRRQVENETDEVPELPRWPGVPQGILRQTHIKTSHVKKKILVMMLQSLYSAQERLWPLGPIVAKYDHLTPYRMAFIFMKLDQLVHEGHSIYMYLKRQYVNKGMTMTRRLQLYSQIMRRNIDVTYLVDYIMERVPRDQVVRIRQWVIRQEQENIMIKKTNWDRTMATAYIQRPTGWWATG